MWEDENSALTEHGVPHEYIVFEHSGHGLQNDNSQHARFMVKVTEYFENIWERNSC